MIIYGVALLSLCTLAGLFIGEILACCSACRPTSVASASPCCC